MYISPITDIQRGVLTGSTLIVLVALTCFRFLNPKPEENNYKKNEKIEPIQVLKAKEIKSCIGTEFL